jgi:hypothetical protein
MAAMLVLVVLLAACLGLPLPSAGMSFDALHSEAQEPAADRTAASRHGGMLPEDADPSQKSKPSLSDPDIVAASPAWYHSVHESPGDPPRAVLSAAGPSRPIAKPPQ